MSDEPTPQPLRLKPRARLENENPPSAPSDSVPPAAESSSSASAPETPKLRLRPKLDPVPPPETIAAPAEATPAVTPPPRTISLKPRLTTEVAPAPVSEPIGGQGSAVEQVPTIPPSPVEPPKFKLKEKPPAPSAEIGTNVAQPPLFVPPLPEVARAAAPAPAVVPSVSLPPPIPSPTPSSGTNPPLPPPASKPPAPPLITEVAESAPAQGSSVKKVLAVALAFVVLIGAWITYRKLAARPAPAPVAEAPKRPSTPSATLNELSTVPARAIEKAKATIATVEKNEKGEVDAVTSSEEPPPRPAPKVEPKPVPVTTATTQISPGITATTTAHDVAGDASPEFKNWVAQARVSGVFQGSPARALINGRTVSAGQIIDEKLEITFEGIDASEKNLVFRDPSGATVLRKF